MISYIVFTEDYPSPAEGNGLENRQACKSVRGFESHILLYLFIYKLNSIILGSYSRGSRGRFAKSLDREIGAWVRIPYSPLFSLFRENKLHTSSLAILMCYRISLKKASPPRACFFIFYFFSASLFLPLFFHRL